MSKTSPLYLAKLHFPVFLPTYNDKITIRLWLMDGRSQVFLANVPEYPSAFDFANISVLRPLEGKMEPRWVNLYGVALNERRPGCP